MRKEIHQIASVALFFIFALVCFAVQSVLFNMSFLSWMQIDLVLLLVAYLGLHKNILTGVVLTLVLAHLVEVHSGSPAGLALSCYVTTFVVITFTREFFLLASPFSYTLAGIVASLTWKITFLTLSGFMGIFDNVWRPTVFFLIPFVLAEGLLANFIFFIAKKTDKFIDEENTDLRLE